MRWESDEERRERVLSKIEEDYDVLEYPNFLIMVRKTHPASKNADFDSIANSLNDYRQAVIEAAQFMYENESYVHAYELTIQPRHYDFEINVSFPFFKGKGGEKELFRQKRIVDVSPKSIKTPSPKDWWFAFARILDWDLSPFKCNDKW